MSTPKFPALVQGVFYVTTGLWPIVHLRSFEAVTGPKADRWLVRAFGALTTVVGMALIAGAFDRERSRAVRILGVGSAVALGLADIVAANRARNTRAYYADAAAEGILATWAATCN